MTHPPLIDVIDAVARGLAMRSAACDAEQATQGLDALMEIELHPLLAESLQNAGFGVSREVRYPADHHRPRASSGERCDLVVTTEGRPLQVEDAHQTLFEPADAVAPEDALWLEVKVVSQYRPERQNRNYSAQLMTAVPRDITKLSKDPGILHAATLLMLFVGTPAVAERDLAEWTRRCLQRGLPIGAPDERTVPINDRIGNAWCHLAVFPVSHY